MTETQLDMELRKLSVQELVELLEKQYGDEVGDWQNWCGLESMLEGFRQGEFESLEELVEEAAWEL